MARTVHGTVKNAVKRFVLICTLMAVGASAAPGQTAIVPAKWIGTWTLSLQESKLPDSLTVISQILKITAAAGHLKGVGDTVISQLGSSRSEFEVNLDGTVN